MYKSNVHGTMICWYCSIPFSLTMLVFQRVETTVVLSIKSNISKRNYVLINRSFKFKHTHTHKMRTYQKYFLYNNFSSTCKWIWLIFFLKLIEFVIKNSICYSLDEYIMTSFKICWMKLNLMQTIYTVLLSKCSHLQNVTYMYVLQCCLVSVEEYSDNVVKLYSQWSCPIQK